VKDQDNHSRPLPKQEAGIVVLVVAKALVALAAAANLLDVLAAITVLAAAFAATQFEPNIIDPENVVLAEVAQHFRLSEHHSTSLRPIKTPGTRPQLNNPAPEEPILESSQE
jgi:hypothetical protein